MYWKSKRKTKTKIEITESLETDRRVGNRGRVWDSDRRAGGGGHC